MIELWVEKSKVGIECINLSHFRLCEFEVVHVNILCKAMLLASLDKRDCLPLDMPSNDDLSYCLAFRGCNLSDTFVSQYINIFDLVNSSWICA